VKKFLDLPLTLGGGIRNPSSFIRLSPGVASTSTWNKSINGGRQFDDEVYYDGIALSRGDLNNDGEVNPSVDAIAEFKLISNNYSAEYSHAAGGITSFTLKSGTNQFHGTGFHFFRNDKLDARSFFSAGKSPVRQNEWRGTIGGPIVKNRTFWFFSFDQFYRRGGQVSGLNTLPTANMQNGDFGDAAVPSQTGARRHFTERHCAPVEQLPGPSPRRLQDGPPDHRQAPHQRHV
jgi:hypothetical protein